MELMQDEEVQTSARTAEQICEVDRMNGFCEGDRNATTDDILAWMPMPEPYKGEQNGKA